MMEAAGVVETVYQNKGGFWTLKLDDGNWYGLGVKSKPDFDKGANVVFNYDKNGNFNNADIKTLEVLKPANTQANTSSGSVNNFDGRQNSIVYQSSRKDAIEVVKIGFEQGALTLPAKKADKLDTIVEMVNELTNRFASEAISPDINKGTPVTTTPGDEFEQ